MIGIRLRQQLLDRHFDECRVCGCRCPIDEVDLLHLSQQMERVRSAKPKRSDVVFLENIEHLDDVEGPRYGRRRADDVVAAIRAAQGIASNCTIAVQILPSNVSARSCHMIHVARAEWTAVKEFRTLPRYSAQCLRIIPVDQARASDNWCAVWHIKLRNLGVARHIWCTIGNALVQIGGHAEPP